MKTHKFIYKILKKKKNPLYQKINTKKKLRVITVKI